MTADELEAGILAARAHGLDSLTLVIPEGFKSPVGFPRGELLCVNSQNERVKRFTLQSLEIVVKSLREAQWDARAQKLEAAC